MARGESSDKSKTTKSKRGFAAMDKEEVRRLAHKGGLARWGEVSDRAEGSGGGRARESGQRESAAERRMARGTAASSEYAEGGESTRVARQVGEESEMENDRGTGIRRAEGRFPVEDSDERQASPGGMEGTRRDNGDLKDDAGGDHRSRMSNADDEDDVAERGSRVRHASTVSRGSGERTSNGEQARRIEEEGGNDDRDDEGRRSSGRNGSRSRR